MPAKQVICSTRGTSGDQAWAGDLRSQTRKFLHSTSVNGRLVGLLLLLSVRRDGFAGVVVAIAKTQLKILALKVLRQWREWNGIRNTSPTGTIEHWISRGAGEFHAGYGSVLQNGKLNGHGSAFQDRRKNRWWKTLLPILIHDLHNRLQVGIKIHPHRVAKDLHSALCTGSGFLGLCVGACDGASDRACDG